MKRRYLSFSENRRAFVLFFVLMMIGALAPILFSVYVLSSKNYDKGNYLKDYITAYHGAVSALKVALYFLKQDNNGYDGEGDDWYKPILYNYKGIAVSVVIRDECGKVNVNEITSPLYFSIVKRLFEELEIDDSVADSIKDWIDKDSEVTGDGAESYYYQSLGYLPSNSPMKSIYELYYVKGIDKKVFDKLADYLTVYGDGKINVNSASKDVLMALSNDMTETAVDSIIESRPITKIEKLKELPGIDQELYFKIRPLITNVCNYFKIDVTASYGDATAEIVAFTDRDRVYEWKVVQ